MIYKKVEIKVEGYQETADLYTYILQQLLQVLQAYLYSGQFCGNASESKAPGHCDLPGWRLYNDL